MTVVMFRKDFRDFPKNMSQLLESAAHQVETYWCFISQSPSLWTIKNRIVIGEAESLLLSDNVLTGEVYD